MKSQTLTGAEHKRGEAAHRRMTMAEMGDDKLRGLIRLIPPARALKEDVEQSLHLEMYAGTGDLAIQSFRGLQASVAAITGDPYVSALALDVPAGASDKEKVSLVRLAAGQLIAFLEGQTGLVDLGGKGRGGGHIQTAPNINLNINGLPGSGVDKIIDLVSDTVKGKEGEAEKARAAEA
jgi:hypothetical protein